MDVLADQFAQLPWMIGLPLALVAIVLGSIVFVLVLDGMLLLFGSHGLSHVMFYQRILNTLQQYEPNMQPIDLETTDRAKAITLHAGFWQRYRGRAQTVRTFVDPHAAEVAGQIVRLTYSIAILSDEDQAMLLTNENVSNDTVVALTRREWLNRDYNNNRSIETLLLGGEHFTVRPFGALIFPVPSGSSAATHEALHVAICDAME